jgi:SARP family transcriptional regulator, regulator of embCAB operon
MPGCWRDLGVVTPRADPDLRAAGPRKRQTTALGRGFPRHRYIPRDELAEALWREPDPAAVDARLNPLLSKLRRVFGSDAVDGRSTLRLCLRDAWVDLEAAVDAIHRAESAVALQDWPRAWGPSLTALFVAERDFLAGEDAPWIDQTRHQLTELRLRALERSGKAATAT